MSTHSHNNSKVQLEIIKDPEVAEKLLKVPTNKNSPKTRTRSKKKTVPPPAEHVNGAQPITVTTRREILIDAVGLMAENNGYVLSAHGDSAGEACVHEAMSFDLVPLDAERHGDLHGSWFWRISIEEALVIVGHLDRDKLELLDDESDKVALGA